jgi:hypothetical protein
MDFEEEFAEFRVFVKSMDFESVSALETKVQVVTLEGQMLELRCHSTNGIWLG